MRKRKKQSLVDALDNFYETVLKAQSCRKPLVGNRPWVKPVESDSLAVHPKDVEAATEDAKKRGVPTEFLKDGRPRFHDSQHIRKYAKAYGFRHYGY